MATNLATHRTYKRALRELVAPFRRLGHEDAAAGQGFRRDYETWSTVAQHAYENGRLTALNIRAAGLTLPTWCEGVVRPRGLPELTSIASARVGPATILRAQED